jgi:small-conductance mechanosensitive channel
MTTFLDDLRFGRIDVQDAIAWAPPWAQGLMTLAAAALAAFLLHGLVIEIVKLTLRDESGFWRSLLKRARRPTRLALMLTAMALVTTFGPVTELQSAIVRQLVLVGLIVLLGWVALIALDIVTSGYLRSLNMKADDNLLARKHITQINVLRQAASILIVVLTAGLALMTIPDVRQWGVSLLAAGGAAGILVGLALQPLLTNLIAGIQIATTQPIRLDDVVVVEGEWGRIEEITATYVVVKLWDWRRLIVPLSHFIQQPFQNWTRENSAIIGTVFIYVDYSASIDGMRAKLDELVKASPLWDGQVVNLAVTDLNERTMQVRCLVSARNSGDAFDLRCYVRERMIAFLNADHPSVLPRSRLEDADIVLKGEDKTG